MKKLKKIPPAQQIALGFFLLIMAGSLLLTLPFFSREGVFTPFIDALFTVTSAVCVTGLTTLNTALHWNSFGHFFIMLFIEMGGLGFMMFPIIFYVLAKKKINLSTRILLRESLNVYEISGVMRLALYIIKFSIFIQLAGAIALAFTFVPKFGLAKGLWYGLFHAVSSFCNAGFDLLGNSLIDYQQDTAIILIMSVLIIAGGLGFFIWRDLMNYRQNKRLTLHTKIALVMTGVLLIGGTVLLFFTENNGKTLVPNGNFFQRLANTFFMSVTPRTAGYASIDYGQMSNAGLMVTMLLMYIGGTSGSTAGGLKTTTFAVLLLQIKSVFQGRSRTEIAGRTIRSATVLRAQVLFFLSLTLCMVSTIILSITEKIPAGYGIEYVAFEVFSALGTTGLSMGLTPHLTIFGKLIIISLMYIGRVGIMTVLLSLLIRSTKQEVQLKYPEENILVG